MDVELKSIPNTRHTCLFYSSNQELLDRLIPYFKEGLDNNELCLWVIPKGWQIDEAKEFLRSRVSDLDNFIDRNQMIILEVSYIYLKDGLFSATEMLESLVSMEKKALRSGFSGIRGSGDCTWALGDHWFNFILYEKQLNKLTESYKIRALCSYDTRGLNVDRIMEIGSSHHSCLVRRMGEWDSLYPDHFLGYK